MLSEAPRNIGRADGKGARIFQYESAFHERTYTRQPPNTNPLMTPPTVDGVTINGAATPSHDRVLTADALTFVARLQRQFNQTRLAILARRADRRARLQRGERLD